METWKTIQDFPKYEVSTLGNVRNIRTGKLLKHQKVSKREYAGVTLYGDNKYIKKTKMVHLLVAEAFLPPKPSAVHQVNHIDGDKMNPRVGNLEWRTPKGNMEHAYTTGLRDNVHKQGCEHSRSRLTKEQVLYIRNSNKSLDLLAAELGVHRTTIHRAATKRTYKNVE
ncbi:HNH endonuclease [Vibrio phage vB_VorS-PVo5]|nr:HNH endonuclease [Vibrio phage vB_VorS-PVo5]